MTNSMFDGQADYEVALLHTLADMPGGQGKPSAVYEAMDHRYHDRIPAEHMLPVAPGREAKWQNLTAWARNELKKRGLLDAPAYGIWRITQAGTEWVAQNPDALRLGGEMRKPSGDARDMSPARPASSEPKSRRPTAMVSGLTLEKLERIRQFMPADEFKRDLGDIYDQLLAEERARAITSANDRYLLDRIRPLVRRIQDFLQGRGNETPKSEVMCDWIFICYTLELHREGAALWRYVNKDEVDAVKYERTAKFSAACRTRASL
jgi:hypothetical protein